MVAMETCFGRLPLGSDRRDAGEVRRVAVQRSKGVVVLALAALLGVAILIFLAVIGAESWASGIILATITAAFTGSVGYLVKLGLDRATSARSLATPLEVLVETNPAKISTFSSAQWDVFLSVPVSRFPSGDSPDSNFYEWSRALGAVPLGTAMLRIVITATKAPVVLTGMRAHVLSREVEPPRGVGLRRPTAGVADVRQMEANLDHDDAPLKMRRRSGRASTETFTLQPGETEVFDVTATLSHGAVRWVLLVDYVVGGQASTMVLREDNPLQLVSTPTRPYVWESGNRWLAIDGRSLSTRQILSDMAT